MTINRAIKILNNEYTCVDTEGCGYSCSECELAGDKEEILEALDMAIQTLKKMLDDGK